MKYVEPRFKLAAFDCPHCQVRSPQIWSISVSVVHNIISSSGHESRDGFKIPDTMAISKCVHCGKIAFWVDKQMIYPLSSMAPMPNPDTPASVMGDYNEARNILQYSPKGAAALLRLAVQKLCIELGGKGKNINHDIKKLVSDGLPDSMQMLLDSVRVVGNNAVHPGVIDLNDDPEVAGKLFMFINLIVDYMITKKNEIAAFYDKLPDSSKEAINKRDGKAT